MFVTTCGEKVAIAERIGQELGFLNPSPPALRIFDAGTGDGTVLASSLRHLHEIFPTVPFFVVGKEISREDARMTLEKLSDRFAEHPEMVVAITNMHYREAPDLRPAGDDQGNRLAWNDVALEGETAYEFDEQLEGLDEVLEQGWKVHTSPKSGNPLYARPSVLVVYRRDHRFLLDEVIPAPAKGAREYDLIIAAQPFRARQAAEHKVRFVLEPLARRLAPRGRMITIQSTGQDPGMEIIRKVWPGEDPFRTPGPLLAGVLRDRLCESRRGAEYDFDTDRQALFRYRLHTRAREAGERFAMSTLLAAWNAAVYVAQIDDRQISEAMSTGKYLDATRDVLERHGGLWFTDEAFVVGRQGG